ncbi:hypothetical protein BLS_008688 [Venturia inaequalis]|uniref:Methyltransferase n=1 Tax=Venturia inaequalis TaxID=5025 RepID=A0A8H3VAE4_VENIN|nr:hypothetical protein BLS_008688 [Venturia inaequalis]KAE9982989.1 hypothetical protein EG327_005654 [Venturia inaequalis]KAE9984022.1 hypothetical protein EG328_009280 [Venturia inaequalis]RDI86287.1 hypothetical protein Vi05172_g3744 [Venturia inaequalis]
MSPSNQGPSGDVEAEFVFIHPPADGSPASVDGDKINEKHITQCSVHDIRGEELLYNLQTHAFQAIRNVSSNANYQTWDSEEEIKRIYYPEVERLLIQNVPGAHSVIFLGHGVRKQGNKEHRQPIRYVHVDHTDQAAKDFIKELADPNVLSERLRHRHRIISVWRPINGAVESEPLAFVAANTLEKAHLHPVQYQRNGVSTSFTAVKHNPDLQWMYWSEMQNDERLLLKCTDSALTNNDRAPHSAFDHSRSPIDAKPRESIEVRALVFG